MFLPYLAMVARQQRREAQRTYSHVAALVAKHDGRTGISESTVSRFECGRHWPENPDAMVAAYAEACGIDQRELWELALATWASGQGQRRRPTARREDRPSQRAA